MLFDLVVAGLSNIADGISRLPSRSAAASCAGIKSVSGALETFSISATFLESWEGSLSLGWIYFSTLSFLRFTNFECERGDFAFV